MKLWEINDDITISKYARNLSFQKIQRRALCCRPRKHSQMETIGIIAAMPQESGALLRLIKAWERSALGPFRCQHFQLNARDCRLVTSGMGLQRAAQAARALLDTFHPQLLVSVGVAGAVYPDLAIGDVIAARNTCLLDKGALGQVMPLAQLSMAAWQAAEKVLQPRRASLFSGIAVSTHAAQLTQDQPGHLTNPILEMETVGIAEVAAQRGIPLLSLRAISDGPRAPIPFDLEAMMDEQYNLQTGKLLRTILGHPKMLPQLMRMSCNTNLAADNAAIALIAVLSLPGPVLSP